VNDHSFPSDAEVTRVMKTLRPLREQERQCQYDASHSLWLIKNYNVLPSSPARSAKQLSEVEKTLNKLRIAIGALPLKWQRSLVRAGVPDATALTKMARESKALADKAKVDVKRGGGGTTARVEHARKLLSAERAFDILVYWCGVAPTLSSSKNTYFDLTVLLYEIATGKSVEMERVCREHFKALERDGFPDAAERNRQRRQWSKHLKALVAAERDGRPLQPPYGPSAAAIGAAAMRDAE
jgi:hypothetical protein